MESTGMFFIIEDFFFLTKNEKVMFFLFWFRITDVAH